MKKRRKKKEETTGQKYNVRRAAIKIVPGVQIFTCTVFATFFTLLTTPVLFSCFDSLQL